MSSFNPSNFFSGASLPAELREKAFDASNFSSVEFADRVQKFAFSDQVAAKTLFEDLPGIWSARFQGERGTCIAFALTCAADILVTQETRNWHEFSPDFLYRHMRLQADSGQINTTIDFDKGATKFDMAIGPLSELGLPPEDDMRYIKTFSDLAAVHSGEGDRFVSPDPGPNVTQAAAQFKFEPVRHDDFMGAAPDENLVETLINELDNNRPVAITLPIWETDKFGASNWWHEDGLKQGKVLDPSEFTAEQTQGAQTLNRVSAHAVCLTGYEPKKGYFRFRNSWGIHWGRTQNPKGAGIVRMETVAKHTIEYMSLKRV